MIEDETSTEHESESKQSPVFVDELPRPVKLKKRNIVFPRRQPSIPVVPPIQIVLTLNRKPKKKKLRQCQQTPLTLYELAAAVVDALPYPDMFNWSEDDVVQWLSEVIGLPQYKECIYDNYINGRRLMWFEDPSKLPLVNIHNFEHIKMITKGVRQLFALEFVWFIRSIGLPPRKPLTHCTWFKSRTGPNWGIRVNWTRSDILRWMKIIMPEPLHMDHWDLVWYMKPDFVRVLFARVKFPKRPNQLPNYEKEICFEYQLPRKFRINQEIADDQQLIWLEHSKGSQEELQRIFDEEKLRVKQQILQEKARKRQAKIDALGIIYKYQGQDLILERRRMPKQKFLAKREEF